MPEKDRRVKVNKYPHRKVLPTVPGMSELRSKKKDEIVSVLTAALNYWQGILQRDPGNEKAMTRIESITNFLKKRSES